MGSYCKFCNMRCFVHAETETRKVPAIHTMNWMSHNYPMLATCPLGKAFDLKALGFNFDNLIELSPKTH